MWLYTTLGHFAPVADPKNKNVIIVRARRADDLDALRNTYMLDLGPNEFDANRDYNVRARISKRKWVEGSIRMMEDITYPSYKQLVHKLQPARYAVYTKIWDATLDLSDCAPAETHKSIYSKSKYNADWGTANADIVVEPFDHINNEFHDPRDYDSADAATFDQSADIKQNQVIDKAIVNMTINTKHICDENCKLTRTGGKWKCVVQVAKWKAMTKNARKK